MQAVKHGDRLSFQHAVRSEQERLLPDEEQPDGAPLEESLSPSIHAPLPIYTTIHKIRREIMTVIDDPYTSEQLKTPRMNKLVVRPLVDELYDPHDISVVYCLLVNRLQFIREQTYETHRQTVNITRALLCEVVATKILRKFDEDHSGRKGLLLLAHVLVTGFEPFEGAPAEVIQECNAATVWAVQRIGGYERKLTALEVALVSKSKYLLSSIASQKVVDAIYHGQIIYTPTTFLDILPDHYKATPISLYDPSHAPLLNHRRLIVPRTRNIMDIVEFMLLLILYILIMYNRDGVKFTWSELIFCIYTSGWVLEELATILEHGWQVYTQNLWSFFDFIFCIFYGIYLILRLRGLTTGQTDPSLQAHMALAMAAPILLPRLAFNLMSENILLVSLRVMMADFMVLTLLAVWCSTGFLLAMKWLSGNVHSSITISKWMLWVWFGLDGTGIQRALEFHWLLGPMLMITFAFLGNTLFLTILVSMLTNTFATIVADATAERQFQRAVLTFEGVKSDAIFAYHTPFNMVALVVLIPLKVLLSPRWFHKINVTAIRVLNAPILVMISLYERRSLWAAATRRYMLPNPEPKLHHTTLPRFSVHGDLQAVFDIELPQSVLDEISNEEALSSYMIDDEFPRRLGKRRSESFSRSKRKAVRALSTSSATELSEQLSELLRDHSNHVVKPRLDSLEKAMARIEDFMRTLSEGISDGVRDEKSNGTTS